MEVATAARMITRYKSPRRPQSSLRPSLSPSRQISSMMLSPRAPKVQAACLLCASACVRQAACKATLHNTLAKQSGWLNSLALCPGISQPGAALHNPVKIWRLAANFSRFVHGRQNPLHMASGEQGKRWQPIQRVFHPWTLSRFSCPRSRTFCIALNITHLYCPTCSCGASEA